MVDYFAFTDALAAVPGAGGNRQSALPAEAAPRMDDAPAPPRPRPASPHGTHADA